MFFCLNRAGSIRQGAQIRYVHQQEISFIMIKLGISSCLLGNTVRYDGGHKQDHFLTDTLGRFVAWVPVCPEVECGLSVPREAMRLVGDPQTSLLLTIKTRIDHTHRMKMWVEEKLDELSRENLSGYIFKSRSPSCGMERIKVYDPESGIPGKTGSGIFAAAFMSRFPLLPVEDEGRLHDPHLRENFIARVFAYNRWQKHVASDTTISNLVAFHTRHKLLLMAHSPTGLRELGTIVSEAQNRKSGDSFCRYITLFMVTLKQMATVKRHTNVLQHIMGYFKQNLSHDEKMELLEIVDQYHQGLVPLIVPVTMLRHYVRKYDQAYLKKQFYLNPHPSELMLLTHV